MLQEENIDYDYKIIEEKLMESYDNDLKEKFNFIKSKLNLESINSSSTLVNIFLKRIVNVFSSNIYYYTNYICLSPFQKYFTSNVLFLSLARRKFYQNNFKIFAGRIKFDFDLPKVFLELKK